MHTCYVPADAVVPGLARRVGRRPRWRRSTSTACPTSGSTRRWSSEVLPRVRAKLATEPIEDLRVDAEDGYRGAPDAEDDDVLRAAAVAGRRPSRPAPRRRRSGSAPSRSRGRPAHRGVRSLDLFLGGVSGGGRAVVTLPKVTDVEQVRGLPARPRRAGGRARRRRVDLELQIETPQAVLGPDGTATLARMVHVAGPRLIGLHYGTYDYSAALGIAAAHQSSDHPAADFAKQVMQVAVAGTGAHAVDGSTNVLPVGPTRARARRLAAARRAGAPGAGTRLLPGLGPAPGPARHPLRRHLRLLPRRAARPPSPGSPPTWTAPRGGVLDEPATARALAGVAAARAGLRRGGRRRRSAPRGARTAPILDKLAGRRPGGS